MPFSSSTINKIYKPFLEKNLTKFDTDRYLTAVDKKNRLAYNVNNYNSCFINVYNLNSGEKINTLNFWETYITSIYLSENNQLLYIGTRYSEIIIFDLKNKCYLCRTEIFIGYDTCGISNICSINNKNSNKETDDIICFCDDYILRKFEWNYDINNKPILELVSNNFHIQDNLYNEYSDLLDVDCMLYNSYDNHIYLITSYIILKINYDTFEITNKIDLMYYIQIINNDILIHFEYNCLIYKDLLILISNRIETNSSLLIIVNLQTQQKVYFNKISNISQICLGNNETEGLLFILGDNNTSVIDLLNIQTTLKYPKYYNNDNYNNDNYNYDEAIYVLSPKSYLLNILQDINGLNSKSYYVDNLDILLIDNNKLILILDDRVIRKYKLENLFISNILYNWSNIFKNKIENHNLESIKYSKLNSLNNDMLFKIFESI